MTSEPAGGRDDGDGEDIEQVLTRLAWNDPSVAEDPAAALSQLGVDVPTGLRFDCASSARTPCTSSSHPHTPTTANTSGW